MRVSATSAIFNIVDRVGDGIKKRQRLMDQAQAQRLKSMADFKKASQAMAQNGSAGSKVRIQI